MFRTAITIVAVLFFAYSSALSAKEIKIGVVKYSKLMATAPQAAMAEKKLTKEFLPRQKRLESLQKKIIAMEEDLKKSGSVMSESQRRKKERDILSQHREFKRAQDEFREDANIRRNEEFIKLRKAVDSVLRVIAKNEGYDIILIEGVAFSTPKVDITDKVLSRLKQVANKK